ncbi:class I SAM-dependent methyltransferase [Halobacillus sp. Marseille-Q1614]|uniref:class I SAM-dependent methyltransferase n=1 Tax=Halobacillus sp. Marseille-Q1614 TaxID=2709134 RepID=UPI00156E3EF9|nr:class I SAM-dependent methyltransferase [Halobacillus sp. Marseille-Q1614]
MLNYYSHLSTKVYDLDKPVGFSFGDLEYYQKQLDSITGKILEPATGTGRLLIPLLQEGFDIEGFDLSSEMLEVCRKNCETHGVDPHLFQDDMTTYLKDSYYDAVIIPTGTFLLLHKREDSIKALRQSYKNLTPGGKFMLDLFIPKGFPIGSVSTRTWELPGGDIITLESKMVEFNVFEQYTLSHNRYERWSRGKLVQTELERFPTRWYGVEEFKQILASIGFKDIVISSDYQHGRPPAASTEMLTFEAKK